MKTWCKGAGQLAIPLRPSSLVTCPECGRPNLNGEEPSSHGMLCGDDVKDGDGNWRMVVPRHSQNPRRLEWLAGQVGRLNGKAFPVDHRCSPNCPVCQ